MPTKGEKSPDGTREWSGKDWTLIDLKKPPVETSVPSSGTEKAKTKTEGYSGVKETQEKSLSQILKEREEKRRKAAVIKNGGSK
jgi:hypothetical protein